MIKVYSLIKRYWVLWARHHDAAEVPPPLLPRETFEVAWEGRVGSFRVLGLRVWDLSSRPESVLSRLCKLYMEAFATNILGFNS